MSGVVLETLSWRKLSILISLLLAGQIICFLVGGLLTPAPNGHSQLLMEKCVDRHIEDPNKWYHTRDVGGKITCLETLSDEEFEKPKYGRNLTADQIVFVAQFPLPRDGIHLNMSRWFQHLVGVLSTDIKYMNEIHMDEDIMLTLDLRLGYRNKGDKQWSELARSRELRPLHCRLEEDAKEKQNSGHDISGFYYDCEILPLFSLGSCYYDEYLLNLKLPFNRANKINTGLGKLQDIWVTEIHQNGGFTIIWFAMKTFMFPLTLTALVFFWYRVNLLSRNMNLLEQTIIALGLFMSMLNLPVEWLSLRYDLSFWLVLSDIRQGGFYAMLLCFWVVFTGEHELEDTQPSHKTTSSRLYHVYARQLLPVASGSCLLFTFELAERGVQLANPFYSVWSHGASAHTALVFVVLAAICGPLYLGFLLVRIVQVVRQILSKRTMLPSLPEVRQRLYRGIIYRFTIFIGYTLFCATLTVIFFVVSQIDESQWKWGEKRLEYTSGFITGVYGMWNFYVISILCLYAPSHKYRHQQQPGDLDNLLSSSLVADVSVPLNASDEMVVCYSTGKLAQGQDEGISLAKRATGSMSKTSPTMAPRSEGQETISNPTPSGIINPLETLMFLNKSGLK